MNPFLERNQLMVSIWILNSLDCCKVRNLKKFLIKWRKSSMLETLKIKTKLWLMFWLPLIHSFLAYRLNDFFPISQSMKTKHGTTVKKRKSCPFLSCIAISDGFLPFYFLTFSLAQGPRINIYAYYESDYFIFPSDKWFIGLLINIFPLF